MRTIAMLAFLLGLGAAPLRAQEAALPASAPAKKLRAPDASREDKLLLVEVVMKSQGVESTSSFVVQAGSQANLKFKGKKSSQIVNLLPVINPNNGNVRAELQFELSAGPDSVWQLQTSSEFKLGKKTHLAVVPVAVDVTFKEAE